MATCADCKHSVFDETWGEYKCKAFERRVYILLDSTECPKYKKKKEKIDNKNVEE